MRYRIKSQSNRKISPLRIFGLDKVDFPLPSPILELLFAGDGGLHGVAHLETDQPMHAITPREAGNGIGSVLLQSRDQIGRDADIERAMRLAGEDIDAVFLHNSHELPYGRHPELTAPTSGHPELVSGSIRRQVHCYPKWMLKQVQHDENVHILHHARDARTALGRGGDVMENDSNDKVAEFSQDWAETQILHTSQIISNLVEQHASLYKWILASNLSINAGAAVTILSVPDLYIWVKLSSLFCFFIGIVSAVLAAVLGQKSIERGLPPNIKMLGLWVKLKATGVYDRQRFDESLGETAHFSKTQKTGRLLSFFSLSTFVLGVFVGGVGLVPKPALEKKTSVHIGAKYTPKVQRNERH